MSSTDLSDLAEALVADGFAGHEVAVRAVVRDGAAAGVAPALLAALTDPRQPEIARLRAFGLVASRLAGDRGRVVTHAA